MVETFTDAKDFVDDPLFAKRRGAALKKLNVSMIDAPIVDIIKTFTEVPHCFTLQCCWGHFVHSGQKNPYGLNTLENYTRDAAIQYRVAYLAICIENSEFGMTLYRDLKRTVQIDARCIQFGSADWFWHKHVNSYVLQVEPEEYMHQDSAIVGINEALYLQAARDQMFEEIRKISLRHGDILL